MDSKCFLTSTDLQSRRARCQHQLSFLLSTHVGPLFGVLANGTILPFTFSHVWLCADKS